ncbi:38K protein [Plodia interpunctella granulovirus]|uniref:38K protein n=1 Tax=Plodia interpunctella granulovirus TaxID=262175 RepID=A0A1L5JH37_9BBAC|nr:38K protein [Plodia interpunctella granulovirus]APO13959.1 38K protein [Plodia interpunctella granulovirus]
MRWTVLHNTWSVVKRHILFVNEYADLQAVSHAILDKIEFVVCRDAISVRWCDPKYTIKYITANDNMRDFRKEFKTTLRLTYLGHIFIMYVRPVTFRLLDEWLVYDINEIDRVSGAASFVPPHVVVFDMDSTLITEEEEVRIRDPAIYDALDVLQNLNCVLCLWSYGEREHVVHSLDKLNLSEYFDIILSEGKRAGEYCVGEELDRQYNVFYKSTPFYLDMTEVKNIPKSPRVVLWYLQQYGINYIKTITLVDDLYDNNINYDNFVNLKTCPVPVKDWDKWQNQIIKFIRAYDSDIDILPSPPHPTPPLLTR